MNKQLINIIIIIELFIVSLIPLVNKQHISLIVGGALNKIILFLIAFLLTFEHFIVGLLFIIGLILMISLNNNQQSNFMPKYDDNLEP